MKDVVMESATNAERPCVDAVPEGALDQVERYMSAMAAGTSDPLGDMVAEHLATGGKRLRARLALGAGGVLGEDADAIYAWAAAVEMMHNATLVHDDVQDGDVVRRGAPTVWARHGAAQAINVGDLMLMLPFRLVKHVPVTDALRWRLASLLAGAAEEVVRGQGAEFALAEGAAPGMEAYRRVCEGKTGALFALPVQGAAIIAGWGEEDVQRIAEPLVRAGVYFQMQDDVLDLYGDKGREQIACDLYEGKFSVLAVSHFQRFPLEQERLLRLLRTPREQTESEEVAWWVDRFRVSGTLAFVLTEMADLRRAIVESEMLAERGLQPLVSRLLAVFGQPIEHVRRLETLCPQASRQWSVA